MTRDTQPTLITCDRCGRPNRTAELTATLDAPMVRRVGDPDSYDLCNACWIDAKSWIKAGPTFGVLRYQHN